MAERYCITAGAWSQTLMHQLSIENGILPVRGQMNLYRFPAQRFTPIINEGSRYLVPREDGHVLAGSCEEEVGFQEDTTPSMVENLHQWAIGLVPALKDAERVRSWAGLRPGSFDGLPYIGKLPDLDNAFVASGHFETGSSLARNSRGHDEDHDSARN